MPRPCCGDGLGKFGRAALLTILATALRAVAAVLFTLASEHSIWVWSWFYIGANLASLLIAYGVFYPRQRLRLRMELYLRRIADSLYVAGAEVLFYLQMEFDKFVVLSFGGAQLARTFSMMLVQRMMRAPELLSRLAVKCGIEGGVFAVSTLALVALGVVLHFFPNALGHNVAEAAPLVMLALCGPGRRNLVEYQAELLFARGQTLVRAVNLGVLAGLKAALLAYVLGAFADTANLVLSLNGVFLLLYLASTVLTYSAMRRPAKAI